MPNTKRSAQKLFTVYELSNKDYCYRLAQIYADKKKFENRAQKND